jgi:hypothetical protein
MTNSRAPQNVSAWQINSNLVITLSLPPKHDDDDEDKENEEDDEGEDEEPAIIREPGRC